MTRPMSRGGLGFRDIEHFNLSLRAQQAWCILTDPTALSVRNLKFKYHPSCDFLDAENGSSPSQVWRSITDGRDRMIHVLIRRVGVGTTTHIWRQNRIPRPLI